MIDYVGGWINEFQFNCVLWIVGICMWDNWIGCLGYEYYFVVLLLESGVIYI